MIEAPLQEACVKVSYPGEPAFEELAETVQKAGGIVSFSSCKTRSKDRCYRERDHKTGQGRDQDNDRKTPYDIANQPGGQRKGNKDHHIHKSDGDGRETDFCSSFQCGHPFFFSLFQVMIDILKHHDGVIDQDADHQR